MTRKIYLVLPFLALFVLAPIFSQASHYASTYVSYSYIGDSTNVPHHYLVEVFVFRNTGGVPVGTGNYNVIVRSDCSPTLNITAQYQAPPAHRQHPNDANAWHIESDYDCANSSASYSFYKYETDVQLPGPCHNYVFSPNFPCCSPFYDNIQGSGSVSGFAFLNNTKEENSCPKLDHKKMVGHFCVKPSGAPPFNRGWFEPNPQADSWVYQPDHALDVKSTHVDTVPFDSGYSVNHPLGTNSQYVVNAVNGQTTFSTSQPGTFLTPIKYTEYKWSMADSSYYLSGIMNIPFLVTVAPSCTPNPDTISIQYPNGLSSLEVICGANALDLVSNAPIAPGSLDSTGQQFSLTTSAGQAVGINSAQMITPRKIRLVLDSSLTQNDTLQITFQPDTSSQQLTNSCSQVQNITDTLQYIVKGCPNVSLSEIAASKLSLYPNPSYGNFRLTGARKQALDAVRLMDQRGRHLREWDGQQERYSVAELPAGIYLLELRFRDGSAAELHKLVLR